MAAEKAETHAESNGSSEEHTQGTKRKAEDAPNSDTKEPELKQSKLEDTLKPSIQKNETPKTDEKSGADATNGKDDDAMETDEHEEKALESKVEDEVCNVYCQLQCSSCLQPTA